MKLHELKPASKAKKRSKRVGRGNASGHGTYSTRGMKGQKSRSGASFYPGFEGGRTPLVKLIPKKKGFKSIFKQSEIVSLSDLEKSFKDNSKVGKKDLIKIGLIKSSKSKAKVVANGEIKKKIHLSIDSCSKRAKELIEKSGGSVKILKGLDANTDLKKNKKNEKTKQGANK